MITVKLLHAKFVISGHTDHFSSVLDKLDLGLG